MKGLDPQPETSSAMERGNYLEPAILAWWLDQHEGEYFHTDAQEWFPLGNWAGATVDLVAAHADIGFDIVEAKSAARMDDWGAPGTDQIPQHYLVQVLFQLAVTGAQRCYVPVIGPYLEFSEYVVERDEPLQAAILERCKEFRDSLAADVPPPLDDHKATFEAVKRAHPSIDRDAEVQLDYDTATEYLEATAALEAATARATGAKTRLLDQMGDARIATCGGIRVARRQPNKYGVSLVATTKTLTPEQGAA